MFCCCMRRAQVRYHDPYVSRLDYDGIQMESVLSLECALQEADCTAIATDHSTYDSQTVGAQAGLLVDTRRSVPSRLGATIQLARN